MQKNYNNYWYTEGKQGQKFSIRKHIKVAIVKKNIKPYHKNLKRDLCGE